MTTMLVGVKPTDPLTFAVMVAVFLVIAVVSSWLPARRAAGLDPTSALREFVTCGGRRDIEAVGHSTSKW